MKKAKILMLIMCFLSYSSPVLSAPLTAGGILYGLTGTSATNSSALTWSSTNKNITLTQGTVTASYPVLDMTSTWNNAAVAFTGIKYNVTNTASTAASNLVDLQVGGSSKFSVRSDGLVTAAGGLSVPTSTIDILLSGGSVFFQHDTSNNIGLGTNTPPKTYAIGLGNIFIGDGAGDSDATTATTAHNVIIGTSAAQTITSGYRNIGVGSLSLANITTGSNNIGMGYNGGEGITTGTWNVLLNSSASSGGYNYSVGINSTVRASNQLSIGGAGKDISDVYIGEGVIDVSPAGFALNATGGSGTNIVGGSMTLAGGKGTGSGNPGSIYLATSTVGASGSTLQSLANRWQVDGPNGGHFIAASDNTYDIGASGASRPRNIYVGTSVTAATSVVSAVFKTTTALVTAGSSGTPAFTANMIGGSGPLTAAQNGWVKMQDSAGATIWIPVWK